MTRNKKEIKELIIRPLTESDILSVALLETEIFPDPWPESTFVEIHDSAEDRVLVAEISGKIVGYAVYLKDYGEARLANIAVTSEFRGKSIAKKLLNCILDIAKDEDCQNIFLDVRPSNLSAIKLYREFGFEELYRRPGYYRTPAEDAIVMVKSLWGE